MLRCDPDFFGTKTVGHFELWLLDVVRASQASFLIMMHPHYRCQGYGTEAARGVFEFGFKYIGLHDIRVLIDSRNAAARAMVLKAGMRLEGEFRENIQLEDEWLSTARYGILRDDYFQATANASAI